MQLPVKNSQGEIVGQLEVSDALFGVPMNKALLHQAMVMYQANLRQGTHDTKTRSEVSGGGRKPWAQKHTGRARQGSIRAPQWRKGGIVFGPHPRSYRQKMPKKMRRLALLCAISDTVREERLTVLESLKLDNAKTKEMAHLFTRLNVGASVLLVTASPDQATSRSVRNLPGVKTISAPLLNALELLRFRHIVMPVEAVRRAESLWAPSPAASQAEGLSQT